MSFVLEEIIEDAKNIPIMLDGSSKKLCELGNRRYETILKSLNGGGDIYLGEKTKQGIAIHLFHIGIFDSLTLDSLGYRIHVKSPEKEVA